MLLLKVDLIECVANAHKIFDYCLEAACCVQINLLLALVDFPFFFYFLVFAIFLCL